jgi:hypothetical protein
MPAERDYDIRNRTVHAREGFDELGLLLPSNPQLEIPDHDTAPVRFLDQEALWVSTLAVSARTLERLRWCRQVSPHRLETHRSGSSTRPSERLTAPDPGGPLRQAATADR